jgi:hypothetical protein
VELYELFAGPKTCFFTMELTYALELVEHLRAGVSTEARYQHCYSASERLETSHPPASCTGTSQALQLLVTPAGRVVVLDFRSLDRVRVYGASDTTLGTGLCTPGTWRLSKAMGAIARAIRRVVRGGRDCSIKSSPPPAVLGGFSES